MKIIPKAVSAQTKKAGSFIKEPYTCSYKKEGSSHIEVSIVLSMNSLKLRFHMFKNSAEDHLLGRGFSVINEQNLLWVT